MEKIERLISIIMILLRKEVVSTREFTELFNESKRTILRDMETLSLSNIPIYSLHGVHGGYGIMEEYKMDKRLLTSADLQNLLTALSGLEQILITEDVEVTIKKIEAMVGPIPLNRSIRMSFYDWEGRSEIQQTIQLCREAIAKTKILNFDYIDKDGARTKRTVEPYQLHFSEMSWYLKGFCLERMGYRTFKLSRMDHLLIDATAFIPRDDVTELVSKTGYQPPLVLVKLLISPRIKDQFIERHGRRCIEEHTPGYSLATIYLPHNIAGFQFLAGFGTDLEIIEPQTYVEDFRNYLSEMIGRYH